MTTVGVAEPAIAGLASPSARLIDGVTGAQWSGERLRAAVDAVAAALASLPPGPIVCLTANDVASVLRYLGVRAADRPAMLVDATIPAAELADLVHRFEPSAVLGLTAGQTRAAGATRVGVRPDPPPPGYGSADAAKAGPMWTRDRAPAHAPHPDLRLLLATSGSTGRPRLVRQSERSVQASAAAIGAALHIDENEVAITALPLYYTLGLSVLHSHLRAGATVVVESRGVLDRGFWDSVDRYGVTSITGVPHTYELLIRQPWRPTDNPSVRRLCASGARIRDAVALHFHTEMQTHGGAFFVMYGQTEAGSRICVLPPEHLPAKLGSVGPPIPGTRLSIEAPGPDGVGEVVCHSDTVMMGYAETAADLARGDDLAGVWPTGDHGRLDGDGYLWLSGRASRIGKAYGVRVSLDAVEHVSSAIAPTAAVAGDDRVLLWCEGIGEERLAEVAALVADRLRIHRTAVIVSAVPELPRRANGKVNYDALPV
jgi:acyl-CoA synthetase (AMP-forming)/AMP-acid ligase II